MMNSFFNHGIRRIHGIIFSFVLLFGFGVSAIAAEPGITVEARQRYPWNGLVDIRFTITGTSGTKYDTSFTAKDVVGGTNITMKTLRKSNGVKANVEKEQLQPLTYNWVWDAAADLPKDFKCSRVTVSGAIERGREKVQLWEGGPYWATMNIGAENPEDYGYYFWWGDTVGYKFNWLYSRWEGSNGSSGGSIFYRENVPTYNITVSTLKNKGWITADGVLVPKHDAAHVHWGGNWRMPTTAEFKALNSNCDWTTATINEIKGYVVRGRGDYASNSIFLPCAGYGAPVPYDYGWHGNYWTSVPCSDSQYGSEYLHFFYESYHLTGGTYRHEGMPIRPVCE